MSTLALLSAILFGSLSTLSLPPVEGVRECYAATADDCLVVAVILDRVDSHEEREELLRDAATFLSSQSGREVVLTQDLLSFLSLKRMAERGVSDYERRALASRLYAARCNLYRTENGVCLQPSA